MMEVSPMVYRRDDGSQRNRRSAFSESENDIKLKYASPERMLQEIEILRSMYGDSSRLRLAEIEFRNLVRG